LQKLASEDFRPEAQFQDSKECDLLLSPPIRTRSTAMFRIHPLEAVFSLIFAPQRDLEDRRYAGTFYIGLGDEFDDDRRLVQAHWSGYISGTEPGVRQNADCVRSSFS
jgi:hypothetical protein